MNTIDKDELKTSLDRLYNLDADVSQDMFVAVSQLRQMINEEFVYTKTLITTNQVWSLVQPILKSNQEKE